MNQKAATHYYLNECIAILTHNSQWVGWKKNKKFAGLFPGRSPFSICFCLCPAKSPEAKAYFNYFDNAGRKSRESTYSWGRKVQIVLKNGLQLIVSFFIPPSAAAGDGLFHLHQTPNRKFFCFPANCGHAAFCRRLIKTFLICRSVLLILCCCCCCLCVFVCSLLAQ